TFSECNQAINIIVCNIRMVVDKLAELRLQTTMEKVYGILVVKVIQMTLVSFKQGGKVLVIDNSIGNGTKLVVPSGSTFSQKKTCTQDSVLSSFGNLSNIAILFEMDEPVLGMTVTEPAVK
ncbi:hypothetical protein BGZ81_004674, partial [Podila clonocystis]